jgi:hypothetical protein
MTYAQRIKILEESYRVLDNKLFQLEKTGEADTEELKKLQEQKNKYLNELRELRRRQYDDSQRVDFDDDR